MRQHECHRGHLIRAQTQNAPFVHVTLGQIYSAWKLFSQHLCSACMAIQQCCFSFCLRKLLLRTIFSDRDNCFFIIDKDNAFRWVHAIRHAGKNSVCATDEKKTPCMAGLNLQLLTLFLVISFLLFFSSSFLLFFTTACAGFCAHFFLQIRA